MTRSKRGWWNLAAMVSIALAVALMMIAPKADAQVNWGAGGGASVGSGGVSGGASAGVGATIGGVNVGASGGISGNNNGIGAGLKGGISAGGMLGGSSVVGGSSVLSGGAETEEEAPEGSCSNYPGVTNRIATCIREAVTRAADLYFDGFYPLVQQAIGAFLTLGVAIYGVLAAAGMVEKVGRDTIMLALKIGCIAYFTTNVHMMYDWAVSSMDSVGEAIVEYTPDKGTATGDIGMDQVTCIRNMKKYAAENAGGYSGPWLAMDCMIDSVIGIRIPTDEAMTGGLKKGAVKHWFNENLKEENTGVSRGMMYLFFSSMNTSIVGVLVALVGFVFMYGMLFLIIKALFTYCTGYIGIAFMMIFAPLFIPLVLFKRTKEYFDKWAKMVVSFMLQPIIILVFVSFSIAAIDLATFSGDYSIMYRIAGDKSREKGFSLNEYLKEHEVIKSRPVVFAQVRTTREAPTGEVSNGPTIMSGVDSKVCVRSFAKMNPEEVKEKCAGYPLRVFRDSIDWEKLAASRQPPVDMADTTAKTVGEQMSREILASALFAAVVIFVMNALLAVVPLIATDLTGELYQSPNLYARAGNWQWQQEGQGQAAGMAQSFSNMVTGRRGGGGGQ